MERELKILILRGDQVSPYLERLAKLRITVFREYPYLYDGDYEYESNYLKPYTETSESRIVLVLDNENVIGASTALPMEYETIEFQKPFIDLSYDISKIFYFGESILLPSYRGRGIYSSLFNAREQCAREYGSQIATFAVVNRHHNDPKKPQTFVPLDNVWNKKGYQKHPEVFTNYSWKEIGEETQTTKEMTFWMKAL